MSSWASTTRPSRPVSGLVVASYAAAAAAWVVVATISPTVQAAYIAAGASVFASVATLVNTWLLRRHERHVDERLDERRVVVARTEDAVTIADEERRQLEDRRARPKTRKVRERRRRRRRKDAL